MSSRRLSTLLPALVFAVLAIAFAWRLLLIEQGKAPNDIPSVMINRPAPDFALPPLIDGKPGAVLADLRGKVVLVNVFASWCGACRAEHATLRELPTQNLTLVGLDYKDKPEDGRAWLAKLGDPYAAIGIDRDGRTGIDFGVYGVPESYLLDKQGVIRFKQTGPLTPEAIRATILPLVERLNRE